MFRHPVFLLIGLLAAGCTPHRALFENANVDMYHWSAAEKGNGGVSVTLFHRFDDSLQRYFFVSYFTSTGFAGNKFDYHVSSVSFHKDSVDLKKLHRIEKYNAGESVLIKRNRKGKFLINCQWGGDKKNTIKIKSNVPPALPMFSCSPQPLYSLHQVHGRVERSPLSPLKQENLLVSQYQVNRLYTTDSLKYCEYVFQFDSIMYVLNGYRNHHGEIVNNCLYEIKPGASAPVRINDFRLKINQVSDAANTKHHYPTGITISLGSNLVLTSGIPPVYQEIRSMKWGAWIGISDCQMVNLKPSGSSLSKGCVKIILL